MLRYQPNERDLRPGLVIAVPVVRSVVKLEQASFERTGTYCSDMPLSHPHSTQNETMAKISGSYVMLSYRNGME